MNGDAVTVREAEVADLGTIQNLIRELARYENLLSDCTGTVDEMREHLFGPTRLARVLLAWRDGAPLGFAVYLFTFSTFRARPVLYLEDLFVTPAGRGQGVARRLLGELALIAEDRGCSRIEWSVLDWNQPAIGFYARIGAEPCREWLKYRLDEAAISALAQERRDARD